MLIHNRIKKHLSKEKASFHMPGHKGREIGGLPAGFGPFNAFDTTELDETLNIYDTGEFNENLFKRTASVFGADMSLYSCGGATLAIQAALFTTAAGKTVLCSNDAHIAAENAFVLSSIEPVYIDNIVGDNIVDEDIIDKTRPAAVFFTSEDYYGRIPIDKLTRISKLCKKRSIPLICDNSHGTHLAFDGRKLHPLCYGADIVIDSAHKTLPVLTGGALLHLTGSYAAEWQSFMRSLKLIASTSPSYLIANSIESGVCFLKDNPERLSWLRSQCEHTKSLLCQKGCLFYDDYGIVTDPYRITPLMENAKAVDDAFKAHGIYSEFSNENHIVLIPSVNNTDEDFQLLNKAIGEIDFIPLKKQSDFNVQTSPKFLAMPPRQAALGKTKRIKVAESAGFIAAEAVYQYPPAVPVVHIGERIEPKIIPTLAAIRDEILVTEQEK